MRNVELLLKKVWPDWRLEKKLGEGSYGTVYKIIKEEYGRTFEDALKVICVPKDEAELNEILTNHIDNRSVTAYLNGIVKDYVNEFALMEQLKGNSHIVSYKDYKVVSHEMYPGSDILIRMELLTPFRKYFQSSVNNEETTIKLGIDICKALEVCHKKNIIHQDIKPQSIFVTEEGQYKLGEFRIARIAEKNEDVKSDKGSYMYMAPEVYKGKEYDYTDDIYSLGILMYQLMNDGRIPFVPPDIPITDAVMEKARYERMNEQTGMQMKAPSHGSKALQDIILKACAYREEDRYQSATDLKNDLMQISKNLNEEGGGKTVEVFGGGNGGNKKNIIAIIAAILVICAGIGIAISILGSRRPEPATTAISKDTTPDTTPGTNSGTTPGTNPGATPGTNPGATTATKPKISLKNPKVVSKESMDSKQLTTWQCIEFGKYPQTEIVDKEKTSGVYKRPWASKSDYVVDQNTYKQLKASKDWDKKGDVVLNGVKYHRIKGDDTTRSESGHKGYYEWDNFSKYHYFRYEPIRWRVLRFLKDNNRALLLADSALDTRKYNSIDNNVTWEGSTLRSWLNGYKDVYNDVGTNYLTHNFIDTAFSPEEQNAIVEKELNNNTTGPNSKRYGGNNTKDKIWLLSADDLYGSKQSRFYGFNKHGVTKDEARRCKPTSYAKARGCWSQSKENGNQGNCNWWLRSPGENGEKAMHVREAGDVDDDGDSVDTTIFSIRPSLILDLSKTNAWKKAGKVRSDKVRGKKKKKASSNKGKKKK